MYISDSSAIVSNSEGGDDLRVGNNVWAIKGLRWVYESKVRKGSVLVQRDECSSRDKPSLFATVCCNENKKEILNSWGLLELNPTNR